MTRSRPYRRIRSWLIWQSGDDPAWILAAQRDLNGKKYPAMIAACHPPRSDGGRKCRANIVAVEAFK